MTVQRWNDEMLDELASTVTDLRESATELRESVTELRESVTDVKDSVDGLRITAQALLSQNASPKLRTFSARL